MCHLRASVYLLMQLDLTGIVANSFPPHSHIPFADPATLSQVNCNQWTFKFFIYLFVLLVS